MHKYIFASALLLAVSAGTGMGCGQKASDDDSASETKTAAASAPKAGKGKGKNKGQGKGKGKHKGKRTDARLDAFADQLEGMVLASDVAGIRGLWITRPDLEGCSVDKSGVDADGAAAFADENQKAFDELAKKELAPEAIGEKVFTNRRFSKHPQYMEGRLTGESCAAKKFGRVNVIVKAPGAPGSVVHHPFNALLIGETWRLYRYLPDHADCSTPEGKKFVGCKKLLTATAGPAGL